MNDKDILSPYSYEYWETKQVPYLMENYDMSETLAKIVFARNWEENHAYLGDLENCIDDEADYAMEIIKQVRKDRD